MKSKTVAASVTTAFALAVVLCATGAYALPSIQYVNDPEVPKFGAVLLVGTVVGVLYMVFASGLPLFIQLVLLFNIRVKHLVVVFRFLYLLLVFPLPKF